MQTFLKKNRKKLHLESCTCMYTLDGNMHMKQKWNEKHFVVPWQVPWGWVAAQEERFEQTGLSFPRFYFY